MKRRHFIRTTGLASGAAALGLIHCSSRRLDYLLTNGFIIDGTGRSSYPADIAIKDGRIAGIGKFSPSDAEKVIDVNGLTVAPGFIDMHSHTETKLLVNPMAESKITQGVTTEMYGMDGDSAAPLSEAMRADWAESMQKRYGIDINWTTFAEYFDLMRAKGHAVNFGSMVGQGTLRDAVIGKSDRAAETDDILKMQHLLEEAISEGAWGLSSGLEYTPGSFADTNEIIQVASVLAGSDKPYTTHMRNEADHLLAAVDESAEIAQKAGIPLHISHLKVQGKRNWNKIGPLMKKLDQLNADGLRTTFDRYPYVAYSTGLANLFPIWAREGGSDKFIERLNDKSQIAEIRKYASDKITMLGDWNSVMISSVISENNMPLQGKRLGEIGELWGMDPFDAAVRLIIEENNRVSTVGFGMSEQNTETILRHKNCTVASDGSGIANHGPLSEGNPHPRSYGTFPRAIATYVRERKIVTLPEMIRRMTSLPAEIIGLKERGILTRHFHADIVVFNRDTIKDNATFENPHQYCSGIEYVFVNGTPVVSAGEITKNLPGMILTS
jgi:N-acyl-D-amino-acid deacylase